jgi:hypothetical protein
MVMRGDICDHEFAGTGVGKPSERTNLDVTEKMSKNRKFVREKTFIIMPPKKEKNAFPKGLFWKKST